MNKFIGIILGLVLFLAPIYDWIANATGWNIGYAALQFLKGGLVWAVILTGLLLLILNLSSLRD